MLLLTLDALGSFQVVGLYVLNKKKSKTDDLKSLSRADSLN